MSSRNRSGKPARRGVIALLGLVLTVALATLATLPLAGSAGISDALSRLGLADSAARDVSALEQRLAELKRKREEARLAALALVRAERAPAEDPQTEPPLHGTNPHGQGTVAGVDLTPSDERPQGGDPAGSDSGEEVVVGRARGEQGADGKYHGHITILALFGQEILGVDTDEGETAAGPLDPVQQGLLDPLCDGSGDQVCISVLTADSETKDNGSSNHFSAANARIGGEGGIQVGAAESDGEISDDGNCQTSRGHSKVADVNAFGQAVADVAESNTESKSCPGQNPQQTNSSSVIGLGGAGLPIPDPGCADGTPDTGLFINPLLAAVCNADETNTAQAPPPSGVREALGVWVLTPVVKATTAASESRALAPGGTCSDTIDNGGDGVADQADPDCHTDGNAGNPNSWNPGNKEDGGAEGNCADTKDNDGDGLIDTADPDCHTDGDPSNSGSYDPNRTENGATCADGKDNDNDDATDRADADCHTDGNANNAASFDPKRSEGGGATECSNGDDDDGDGHTDRADPGCHTDGDAGNSDSYDASDDDESDETTTQCSNGADDDGDDKVDANDPGCHSDNDASNADSYVASDDNETDGSGVAGETAGDALGDGGAAERNLALTGTDLLGVMLGGLMLLAAGLLMRRRLTDLV